MTDMLVERIARAWLHHLGYTDDQIDAARRVMLHANPHLEYGCEPDGAGAYTDCTCEDGTSRHPEIDDIGDASVYAYVVAEALREPISDLHQQLCNIVFHEDMNTMLTGAYYMSGLQKHYPTNDERAEMFAEALHEVRAELYTEQWKDVL